MDINLFEELKENKLRIVKNYKIREIVGKPKNETFIEHFKKVMKQKDKWSDINKITKKIDINKEEFDLFRCMIGSIESFDEVTVDYLTCYISYLDGSKDLNDNREKYMNGYEDMFVDKSKKLINNYEKLSLEVLNDTGLTKDILQDLIDNKTEILKNYYYRQELSDISGKTHLDKFINCIKTKDSITNINDLSKKAPQFLFVRIFNCIFKHY